MNYDKFCKWLMLNKHMNYRSAKDVVSRCRRVCNISGILNIDGQTETQLIKTSEYNGFSIFVKSQLKRCITLYNEFLNE